MADGTAPGEAHIDMLKWTDRVKAALDQRNKAAGKADLWINIESITSDRVVVNDGNSGKLLAHAITLGADGAIVLGPAQEMVELFVPATSPAMPPTDPPVVISSGRLLEAKGGAKFKVRAIRAGLSGNTTFYPDRVLREAAPLFGGVRVLVKGDAEHLKGVGKHPENIIGRLINPIFVNGVSPDTGEILATMELLESAGEMPARLAEAVNRGMADLYGLSIVATGKTSFQQVDGVRVRIAESIDTIESVDLIVEAGAGGAIMAFAEAKAKSATNQQGTDLMKKFLLDQIRARKADLLTGKDPETMTEEEVQALFKEAFPESGASNPPADHAKAGDPGAGTTQTSTIETKPDTSTSSTTTPDIGAEVTKAVEAETHLREALGGSGLPQASRERIETALRGTRFSPGAVDAAIARERDYLARVTGGGRVSGLGGTRTQLVESQRTKIDKMLDVLLGSAAPGNGDTLSFREAYGRMTGDWGVTGRVRRADLSVMREALGTDDWVDVMGDAINRRALADYRTGSQYDVWRELANVIPVNDFRPREGVRMGGFGDLPDVAESGEYLVGTDPAIEVATYKVTKRGRRWAVTLEMIKNDNIGLLRQLPISMSRAAKRTLAKFVLDFLRDNRAIYDAKLLFHIDHGNLITVPLSLDNWDVARLAMMAQTEMNTNEPLGIPPRNLWVPPGMERTAADLFRRDTNLDPNFLQTNAPKIIPVWYWTDPNDWCATADRLDIPSVEIGFLDGNEEPEIVVADSPTSGSLFTNDQVEYKIRHIYGGAVTDYRGLLKSQVA
ncbi:MAG: hypothetical protein HQL97_04485 [Magnetococcales bacterium]|nr:hypothetical protein [Magnetococcales bacterium]